MYLSNYFLPFLKDEPKDAQIVSHRLMLKSGMIKQLSAGIYSWLPFGNAVLRNIERIVREEMNNAGAVEMIMPCIQPVEIWKQSGRFGEEGDLSEQMLKITDRSETDLTFSPTAEEVVTDVFKSYIQSYKSLPVSVYQIQWKFRDEIRPRFGVMRSREFFMKDAYTFHADKECGIKWYKNMLSAYLKIYKRLGLTAVPVAAPTGAMGGDLSHEFHVLADTGESEIFYEDGMLEYLADEEIDLKQLDKFYANEEEKHDEKTCDVPSEKLHKRRGIEVGHIFHLGDKYTKAMDAKVQDRDGKLIHPLMGCYGIGVSRLVGAIIEASHDDKGIVWPENVAPFKVGILNLKTGDNLCDQMTTDLYDALRAHGIEVLVNDSADGVSAKFSKFEMIGLPWLVAIGPRLAKNGVVEVIQRKTGEKHEISLDAATSMLSKL